jgi:hypothetical protein
MSDLESPEKTNKIKWLPILVLILFVVGAIGLFVHKKNKVSTPAQTSPSAQTSSDTSTFNIDSLISYQLPDGWTTQDCGGENDVVLIVPAQRVKPDCASLADSWPMKFSKDPQNTTDCNQIKVNNQQVTNHVCSSQNINGQKIFVSSTTYNNKSVYGKDTKVSDYYVESKKGVIKLEYADDLTSSEDDYQAQFDQIANSIKVK